MPANVKAPVQVATKANVDDALVIGTDRRPTTIRLRSWLDDHRLGTCQLLGDFGAIIDPRRATSAPDPLTTMSECQSMKWTRRP